MLVKSEWKDRRARTRPTSHMVACNHHPHVIRTGAERRGNQGQCEHHQLKSRCHGRENSINALSPRLQRFVRHVSMFFVRLAMATALPLVVLALALVTPALCSSTYCMWLVVARDHVTGSATACLSIHPKRACLELGRLQFTLAVPALRTPHRIPHPLTCSKISCVSTVFS
jgi:hypothetical protein